MLGCTPSLTVFTHPRLLANLVPSLPLEADPSAVPPAGGGVGAPAHRSLLHPETPCDH